LAGVVLVSLLVSIGLSALLHRSVRSSFEVETMSAVQPPSVTAAPTAIASSEPPKSKNAKPAPEPKAKPALAASQPKVTPLPAVMPDKPKPEAKTPAVAASQPVAKATVPFKRRQLLDRASLTRQLLGVSEVDSGTLRLLSQEVNDGRARTGLPVRMGADCHLDREDAENLQVLSRRLREHLGNSLPKDEHDPRIDADQLRQRLLAERVGALCPWVQDEAVPVLIQLLQAENRPVRRLLVELLSRIPGPNASAAIARRAIYDLDSDIRQAAVRALADRPRADYRAILLEGLRYPWPPIADHAAEALVAVQDRQAVSSLKRLETEPDPRGPVRDESTAHSGYVVRELVRINHLSNCASCHARSTSSTDLVRAAIPNRGHPLQPPTSQYGQSGGTFIHADVTYLQQDFSVMQPVANHGPWPGHQRFDYFVRSRPATRTEIIFDSGRDSPYPQRDAVQFALRELQREGDRPAMALAK
jgi:hypothetical protein